MKLTAIFFLGICLQVTASGLGQTVTFSGKKVPLEKVFAVIKEQTGYLVSYNTRQIRSVKPVTIAATQLPLQDFLQKILNEPGFEFVIEGKTIFIRKSNPSAGTQQAPLLFASLIDIKGRILNERSEPVIASIAIRGTNRGTNSDMEGRFELLQVEDGAVLIITATNIETMLVDVGKAGISITDRSKGILNLPITVKMSASSLDEVVVNKGYYSERKKLSTGSVSKISSKQIGKQPVTNVLAAMQGSMPGVDVTQGSGIPGGGFKVQIRGRNSVREEGNDPLYIIDGVPFSSQTLTRTSSTVFLSSEKPSPLNGINASDIESIEVLKDADATAIYGSRGANGVVLITTKRGKAGETSFFVDAYKGTGKVTRTLHLLNTQQYLEMRREGFANDGLTDSSPEYATAYDINGTWDQDAYTDWQKQIIGGSAGSSQIQAGITGGNNNTHFLMSGTLSKENTVFPGSYAYIKGSVHFSLNHSSSNGRFSASITTSYGLDKNDLPGEDLTYKVVPLPPNHPALYKSNGELNWENVYDNPFAALESNYLLKNNTLVASSSLEYNILPGLQIKTLLGFNDNRTMESKTSPYTMYNPAWGYGNTPAASSFSLNNSLRKGWSIEPQISWVKSIGNGTLSMLAGTTFQESNMSGVYNSAYDFTTDELITNLSAAAHSYVYSNQSTYRYTAIFGRINYTLSEKYILNLTTRRDGSSRFGPGKRFGNFGAVGAAWIFTKEKMINPLFPALSFGKLKASYGTSGNDQIGDYQFLNTYTPDYTNYDGVVGLQPTRLFNPDFSWETNKKLELALELGFLNDQIMLATSYYRNRSSNQLVGIPLPSTTGFSSVQANLNAVVQNTGWEIELQTINIAKKHFRWTTSVNMTFPRNKLISFPNLEASTFSDYIIGKSLGIRRAYFYGGLNTSTGVYQVKDANGDGVVDYYTDRDNLIDLSRTFFGGLSSEVTIGHFEFSLLFQIVKQIGLNYIGTWSTPPGNMGNQPIQVLDRWQKPGDDKPIQRYTASYGDVYNAYWKSYGTEKGLGDASFVRLKNLSASYRFSNDWLHVQECRVYIQAQNLLTITRFEGPDPENQLTFALPPIRMVTAGIKLTL